MLATAMNVPSADVERLLRRAFEEDGSMVDIGGLRATYRRIPGRARSAREARRELVIERYLVLDGATLAGMLGETEASK